MSKTLSMISWTASREELNLVGRIVERAEREGLVFGDKMRLEMDLIACNANGTPLDLSGLVESSRLDFAHDLGGIASHINRRTGTLMDCFVPRYAVQNQTK